ncbi:MAG: SGNH/GDSL hydrolase family protein [Deltaproteobacteria bacterium]|nr:SGNH/GDSL hydrolase family protein [Deltaproteobacteria bacterium]
MSEHVVSKMTAVLARSSGRASVFAKVGDSITAHGHFLRCFAGDDIQWGEHAGLDEARGFFAKTRIDEGHVSFDRSSLAARSGWSTRAPMQGTPSLLEREVAAIHPGFAVVMLGTNDVYPAGVEPFERNLGAVLDRVLELGVVPLVSTIPPRNWSKQANSVIPEMNAVILALAQSRQVPWMDYHAALAALPGHGLAKDGIHPQTYKERGLGHPCWLTENALQQGINARNLIVLQALDRAKRFLVDRQLPEQAPPALQGSGDRNAPFVVPELPFADARERSATLIANAEGETVYSVSMASPARVRVRVFGDEGADLRLRVQTGDQGEEEVQGGARVADVTIGPAGARLVVRMSSRDGASAGQGFRVTMVALPP